jgi:hypothetical protein
MKSINYLHTSHDTYYVQQGQEGGVTLIALSFSQVSTRTHIHTQMPATARKRRTEKDEIDLTVFCTRGMANITCKRE